MNLLFALAAGTLFGAGAYLLLHRDLVRVVLGVAVISQSATLTVMASGLTRGSAPIYPLSELPVSDSLAQAMALTAIVIGLAVLALLLVLVLRVVRAFRSSGLDEVAAEEVAMEAELERRRGYEHEEEEEEMHA
ncbi:MAG TPA: NADH-quinone oxidoreductase subunit K [Solirubrobacterales bacterium]